MKKLIPILLGLLLLAGCAGGTKNEDTFDAMMEKGEIIVGNLKPICFKLLQILTLILFDSICPTVMSAFLQVWKIVSKSSSHAIIS